MGDVVRKEFGCHSGKAKRKDKLPKFDDTLDDGIESLSRFCCSSFCCSAPRSPPPSASGYPFFPAKHPPSPSFKASPVASFEHLPSSPDPALSNLPLCEDTGPLSSPLPFEASPEASLSGVSVWWPSFEHVSDASFNNKDFSAPRCPLEDASLSFCEASFDASSNNFSTRSTRRSMTNTSKGGLHSKKTLAPKVDRTSAKLENLSKKFPIDPKTQSSSKREQ
mmetsp:Transcript_80366/g.176166  ORF Transcript_80366/g.176166 Transcript_80366/m.176166 type:complete len:222 (+) Transcript_80366:202-867(+)